MQLRQRMDLDQINERMNNEPIKPLLNQTNNENHLQNNNQIKKPKSLTTSKQKRSNRTFGNDITNQARIHPNIPSQTQSNKSNDLNNSSDGFSFNKPLIIIEKGKEEKQSEKEALETETATEMERDMEEEEEEEEQGEGQECDIIVDESLGVWDKMDIENDLCVTDYVSDIMLSLREDENINRGDCIIKNNIDFMNQQSDVNARMRTVLVDWLVEVHRKFKLLPATYFLGINLLDRYLVKRQLHRRKLQLCGCTCLWIASKYHEIYAPEMDDFIYISDNAFNDEDLMNMEIEILKTLSFTLTVPTVHNYAQRYTKISAYYLKKKKEMKIISDLIMYCIEHSVMCYDLCRMPPSKISAAAFVYSCVSTKVFTISTFEHDEIGKEIGYNLQELIPVMVEIDNIVRNAKKGKHKAVFKKYCNSKYSNIGKLNFNKLNTSFLEQANK